MLKFMQKRDKWTHGPTHARTEGRSLWPQAGDKKVMHQTADMADMGCRWLNYKSQQGFSECSLLILQTDCNGCSCLTDKKEWKHIQSEHKIG